MKKAVIYAISAMLLLGVCIAVFLSDTQKAAEADNAAAAESLRRSLYRSALACSAAEGAYPDTLEYLCENYGPESIDGRWSVHYEIFASNIMPEITVVTLDEK